MFTIFVQHFHNKFLSGRLLLVVMDGQKSKLICGFKLELIQTYHL